MAWGALNPIGGMTPVHCCSAGGLSSHCTGILEVSLIVSCRAAKAGLQSALSQWHFCLYRAAVKGIPLFCAQAWHCGGLLAGRRRGALSNARSSTAFNRHMPAEASSTCPTCLLVLAPAFVQSHCTSAHHAAAVQVLVPMSDLVS
jgi:hypothetical protein